MLRAILIDDENKALISLKLSIEEYCPNVSIVGQANSIDIAIEEINNKKPDLIFLDIEMPKGGGFDLLKRIPERKFEVIFITAYDYYAIKAFKYSAVDYILKPVNIKELIAAVKKAEENIKLKSNNEEKYDVLIENIESNSPKILAIPTLNGVEYINTTKIIRIEASRSYSDVFLNNNIKKTFSLSLSEFHNMLMNEKDFYRCHKSHLINLNFIESFSRKHYSGEIKMTDGSLVEVAHRKRLEFIQIMKEFTKSRTKQ